MDQFNDLQPVVECKRGLSLEAYIPELKRCDAAMKTLDNKLLKQAVNYGQWLVEAKQQFKKEQPKGSFEDWVNKNIKLSKTRCYQLIKLNTLFAPYSKVLNCALPLSFFITNGTKIVKYFHEHPNIVGQWI
jgi:hypothetical protein